MIKQIQCVFFFIQDLIWRWKSLKAALPDRPLTFWDPSLYCTGHQSPSEFCIFSKRFRQDSCRLAVVNDQSLASQLARSSKNVNLNNNRDLMNQRKLCHRKWMEFFLSVSLFLCLRRPTINKQLTELWGDCSKRKKSSVGKTKIFFGIHVWCRMLRCRICGTISAGWFWVVNWMANVGAFCVTSCQRGELRWNFLSPRSATIDASLRNLFCHQIRADAYVSIASSEKRTLSTAKSSFYEGNHAWPPKRGPSWKFRQRKWASSCGNATYRMEAIKLPTLELGLWWSSTYDSRCLLSTRHIVASDACA